MQHGPTPTQGRRVAAEEALVESTAIAPEKSTSFPVRECACNKTHQGGKHHHGGEDRLCFTHVKPERTGGCDAWRQSRNDQPSHRLPACTGWT
jgi:hypothetical protein